MYFQVYTGCVGSYNPTWLNWGQPDPDSCFSKTTAPKGGSTSCYIVNSLLLPTSYTSAVNPMGCGGDSSGGGGTLHKDEGTMFTKRYSAVVALVGPGATGGGLPFQAPTPSIFFYVMVAGLLILPALPFLISRLSRHLHKTDSTGTK